MTKLNVPDMSCGHCKAAVEKAIHGLDATASVAVDLEHRTVTVDDRLDLSAVQAALSAQGYPSSPAG